MIVFGIWKGNGNGRTDTHYGLGKGIRRRATESGIIQGEQACTGIPSGHCTFILFSISFFFSLPFTKRQKNLEWISCSRVATDFAPIVIIPPFHNGTSVDAHRHDEGMTKA